MNLLELARSALAHPPRATTKPAEDEAAHYRWRVTTPDGTPLEVCCLPELTLAEMRELYRGAAVEPVAKGGA